MNDQKKQELQERLEKDPGMTLAKAYLEGFKTGGKLSVEVTMKTLRQFMAFTEEEVIWELENPEESEEIVAQIKQNLS